MKERDRETHNYLAECLAAARAANLAAGVCVDCGGSGIVADLAKMWRTGDPHLSRTCRLCRGTGKPRKRAEVPTS